MASVLITGGGGFLGKALGRALRARGFDVISVARGDYPELQTEGIKHIRLDLSKDQELLIKAVRGVEAIFHVAAKVDMWGDYRDFYSGNVLATRHVIQAAKQNGVRNLIFTSSPSVVADGKDLLGVNEDYPYPAKYSAFYPQTKAMAEKEVLSENSESLKTISLRPHLIWGKGDTNLIPTILEKAGKGKLMIIGDGQNRTDLTYIDDCVNAHILAFEALKKDPELCSGKAYFISQGDPVKMWDWVNQILDIHNLQPVTKRVNKRLAMGLAFVLENLSRVRPGNPEPLLTRFLVSEMSTSHYFDISRARQEIGYTPSCSVQEAMSRCFS